MGSIHDTSLRYLIDFAEGKSDHPLLQRMQYTQETKVVDEHTVELVEITAIFFRQLLAENEAELGTTLTRLAARMTPAQLMASVETRLTPLLKQVLATEELTGKGVEGKKLIERIQTVADNIHKPSSVSKPSRFNGIKQMTANAVVKYAKSDLVEVMGDYKKQCRKMRADLYKETGSTVAAEFARVTSKTVYNFLSDEILHVKERDPVVRPFFLKGNIFTEETTFTTDPKYTFVGELLAGLLQEIPGGFQKVIELNILNGTTKIVSFLDGLKKKQPFFLVELCNRCLADLANDPQFATSTSQEQQVMIMEKFTKSATELIFDIAFPKGAQDLIMPSLGGTHRFIRHKLWKLVQDVLKDQMNTFLTDLPGKSDLKNMLLIEGYGALTPFLATENKPVGMVQRAATVTGQTAQTVTLAPVGFVFIFIRLIISSVLSVFQQKGPPPVNPKNIYPNQGTFNAYLTTIVNQIIQDTDSKLLKFIASRKLESFISEYGPSIVEAICEIDYMEIFNAQFEGFIASVISPGGAWKGEKEKMRYEINPLNIPKTLSELEAKEATLRREEEARAEEVERLQRKLGTNIDGLLREIAKAYRVEHKDFTEDELVSKTTAEKMVNKLHGLWAAFANAIIYRLVQFTAFMLDAKGKIQASSGAFHRKMQKVPQERFVMVAGEFAKQQLRIQQQG